MGAAVSQYCDISDLFAFIHPHTYAPLCGLNTLFRIFNLLLVNFLLECSLLALYYIAYIRHKSNLFQLCHIRASKKLPENFPAAPIENKKSCHQKNRWAMSTTMGRVISVLSMKSTKRSRILTGRLEPKITAPVSDI